MRPSVEMAPDRLSKQHALLFIPPANHDAFFALATRHLSATSSPTKPTNAESVAVEFLEAYGKQLWPRFEHQRKHLDPGPAKKYLGHWKLRKASVQDPPDGPIFVYDAFMTPTAKNEWYRKNHTRQPKERDHFLNSKLGETVNSYFRILMDLNNKGSVYGAMLSREQLLERVLKEKGTEKSAIAAIQGEVVCRGEKRKADAIEAPATSSSPAKRKKKQKTVAKSSSSPPQGTFIIPGGLKRVEALPFRKPPPFQPRAAADYLASVRPTAVQAPPLQPKYPAVMDLSEEMEMMGQPQLPLGEAEMRARLSQYMEETGGIGGLPIV